MKKNFLAILMAVDKWRSYLSRGPFIIRTDHKSLCHLDDQALHTDMQKKAMTRLVGLQFKFQYKKGEENVVADALSRVGHAFSILAISGGQPIWLQEVLNSYTVDSKAQHLRQQLAISSPNEEGYSLEDGLIKYKGCIWVGRNVGLQTKIIDALHSSAIGGHSGIQATYCRIKKLFTWVGLKQAVEDFVKQCDICQKAKHEHCKTPGLLQPLPVPQGAWEDISMDFIEGLPKSNGYDVILVVVDRFTKYAHFLPLKHPYTAMSVAQSLLQHVIKLHGVPKTIVSDRDPVFTSNFWTELFHVFNTKLQMSTAYHPQSDGQTERINQCLEMYLRCATHDRPKKWYNWLHLAEFWYNTSFHVSLKCTPFKALYGHDPNYGICPIPVATTNLEVQDLLLERHLSSELLKQTLERAQNRMKHYADANRSPREFQVGEQVLLKLQPYSQSSVVNRPFPKLAFKFFGPYEVLSKIGTVAYKVRLPDTSLIHPVFHVSQLKPFTPKYVAESDDLPVPIALDSAEVFPERILERRLSRKGDKAHLQVRIKWTSIPESSSTWEDYEVLKEHFPDAPAWGQSDSQDGGSVIPVGDDNE